MESQIENSMENSSSADSEPKREISQPRKSGFLWIMIFLIICLAGGLTYYVLKDNVVDLSSSIPSTKETGTTDNKQCPECKIDPTNSGWSLFTVPGYNLSVEIPTYTLTQKLESENIPSVWKVWYNNTALVSYLDDYIGTMNVHFYPTRIPEGMRCGQGCVGEHTIYVNIHTNTNTQNLASAMSSYRTKWEKMYVEGSGGDIKSTNLKGETVSKWNTDVWSFRYELPGGTWKGYLVVKDGYIYDVEYYLSDTPKASYDIALKVLDSLKFEQ